MVLLLTKYIIIHHLLFISHHLLFNIRHLLFIKHLGSSGSGHSQEHKDRKGRSKGSSGSESDATSIISRSTRGEMVIRADGSLRGETPPMSVNSMPMGSAIPPVGQMTGIGPAAPIQPLMPPGVVGMGPGMVPGMVPGMSPSMAPPPPPMGFAVGQHAVPMPRQLGTMPEDMSGSRQSFRMAMGNPCEFFVDVM